jgi:hypothetical protein
MKTTLTTWQIADALKRDDNAGWSYEGSKAIAEYLDQLDQETGEDTELDIVAIRCDWSEYDSPENAAEEFGWGKDDQREGEDLEEYNDRMEGEALEWLQDRTQVIEFNGGIIIAQF